MVDRKRMAEIDRMVEKLRGLWKTFPQLRLGQLLTNAACSGEELLDVYLVEDRDMGTLMDDYYREHYLEGETDGR